MSYLYVLIFIIILFVILQIIFMLPWGYILLVVFLWWLIHKIYVLLTTKKEEPTYESTNETYDPDIIDVDYKVIEEEEV